jgi:DNA-directed RNA polymerase subunit beta'
MKTVDFAKKCTVDFFRFLDQTYQMGYIKLACRVTHVWYLKGLSSYIANLLNKPLTKLDGLVYGDFFDRVTREEGMNDPNNIIHYI